MNRFPRKTGNFSRKANFWFGTINWRLSELSGGRDYRVYIFTEEKGSFRPTTKHQNLEVHHQGPLPFLSFRQNLIAGHILFGAKSGQSMGQMSHLAPPDPKTKLYHTEGFGNHQVTRPHSSQKENTNI